MSVFRPLCQPCKKSSFSFHPRQNLCYLLCIVSDRFWVIILESGKPNLMKSWRWVLSTRFCIIVLGSGKTETWLMRELTMILCYGDSMRQRGVHRRRILGSWVGPRPHPPDHRRHWSRTWCAAIACHSGCWRTRRTSGGGDGGGRRRRLTARWGRARRWRRGWWCRGPSCCSVPQWMCWPRMCHHHCCEERARAGIFLEQSSDK